MKFFLILFTPLSLFAAHESLKAWTEVVSAIHLSKTRDLDFGEGLQGDPPKNIAPQSGAQFQVTGEPHRAYQILIPNQVVLKTASGDSPNEQIQVTAFQSFPDKSGKLDCDGRQNLNIGATRGSLLPTQKSGVYLAPFTVTVMYQ